ncbi:MAG: hypothetical protein EA394_00040 [Bacteroidia bacterium]|nr:MAG: hypothetical protein EA394_00040 [Bacteroidia bacterium]
MEAIILQGGSKSNSKLLMELARKLNFKARKLSSEEMEEMGIILSIQQGLSTGLLNETEKAGFLNS